MKLKEQNCGSGRRESRRCRQSLWQTHNEGVPFCVEETIAGGEERRAARGSLMRAGVDAWCLSPALQRG